MNIFLSVTESYGTDCDQLTVNAGTIQASKGTWKGYSNISSHQEKFKTKPQWDVSPHVRMTSKRQENKCWQGYGEGKSFCTASGNVNWYSYYGK